MAIEMERVTIQATTDGRLTPAAAAAYLGVSPRTLSTWRYLRRGPAYLKRPRIAYKLAELDRLLRDGEVTPRG